MQWKLKGCPRCGGDIFLDTDSDYWYELCLQCAYRRELKDISEFGKQPACANKTIALSRKFPRIP